MFYAVFNSFQPHSSDSLHYLCLSMVSSVLGGVLLCPKGYCLENPRGFSAVRTQDLMLTEPYRRAFYFPNNKSLYTLPNSKIGLLQTTILNLKKIVESPLKRIENAVGKGGIARYEQFLLFRQSY